MIPYIIYVALITSICFLFYRVLLQRETFFGLNRWFFLCCLIGSFGLPLLHLPQGWSLRAQASPISTQSAEKTVDLPQVANQPFIDPDPVPELHNLASSNPGRVSKEVSVSPSSASGLLKTRLPAPEPSSPVKNSSKDEGFSISLLQLVNWVYYIYICGVLIFASILLTQVAVLVFQVRTHAIIKDGIFRIVQTRGDRAPCSFGRYIFINPSLYDEETLEQILSHEKIHVRQRHSLDIVLAELCIVVQWFNPFAWLYRKALEDNLEFLTDAAIIRKPGTNSSQYQMSLLRVSAPHLPLSITSNYNQSLLKKRMIMMHAQKSSVRTTWKYLFLLPLLTGIVCLFNDPSAISQNIITDKSEQQNSHLNTGDNSASSAAQRSQINGTIKAEPAFSGGPAKGRFSNGDTDIVSHVQLISSVASNPIVTTNVQVVTDVLPMTVLPVVTIDPIVHVDPVIVPHVNLIGNFNPIDERKGTWMATLRGDTVELTMKSEEGEGYRNYSTNSEILMKSEFSSIPTGQKADFTVTREAGTLSLHGVFDGDEGFGHYTFKENTDFQNYLVKAGITEVTDQRMFGAFFANVTKSYVESLLQAGFGKLPIHSLIGMAAMKVDVAYIQSWKKLYPDLQPHDLIGLKSMKIDGSYLKELQDAGFKDLAPHDLIGAKSVGIDAAYAGSWKQSGYTDYSIHDLISAKSVGVDPAYVQGWKQAGLTDLSIRDLVSAKSTGIDPSYMQAWKEAGFADVSIRELISAKSVGVDPAYVKSWKQAGLTDLSIRDMVSAKASGIDVAYRQAWKEAGFADLSIHELISAKSSGLEQTYVQTWKQAGYTDLSIHDLISAKSIGIEPAYAQKWKQAGYNDLSIHDLMSAKSIGIDPAYFEEWKKAGFNDLSIRELIELKSMKITVAYAQSWKDQGYKDFSIHDLISLKSQNIDGSYVDSWKSLGYSDLAAHDLVALKSVGVNAAYLKEMESAGFSHLEPHELIGLKSQGITPEFIKGFQSLGFKNIPAHILVEMKSLGITPDYISTMRTKGFNSADLQEYIKLKTFR